MLHDLEALPQPIGDYKPVDYWQAHINELFYRLRGDQLRQYYQTFASADYRLAHALAQDYYERVTKREQALGATRGTGEKGETEAQGQSRPSRPLIIHEWGPGNGNLAACFLTHLQRLDKDGRVYPRIRYVLVDRHPATLEQAKAHPDLAPHRERVETLCADVANLAAVKDGTVDRIICNELWNDLPTKLMVRKAGEIEEEHLRPNLSETKHAQITDWSGFVRAFEAKDADTLKGFPPFFEDLVWEKEYHKVEWKDTPYRKTIVEFLKQIDEQVLVPVNLGAFATLKEAKRILTPDAVGFSSFDAGAAELKVLNNPDKPCYGQFGGQYSFMINFPLVAAVAKQLGIPAVVVEAQREFVGRSLNTHVITLMDLLAVHPSAGQKLEPWERDRLVIKTIRALNETVHSPYERKLEFPIRKETPPEERETLQGILLSLKKDGVPDTVAYLTEDELYRAMPDLEAIGYDRELIKMALEAPLSDIEYFHMFCALN